MTDYELMGAALAEAEKAAALGEVPVGAVVAKDGEIVAAAHNTRETEKNALHHAELLAPIQSYLAETLHQPEALVRQIGCVIGTHAGPGAFGFAFFDKALVIE